MINGAQEKIREYIMTRGRVTSEELIKLGISWDHRKIISRLRRKGYPIENVAKPGDKFGIYVWVEQPKLL